MRAAAWLFLGLLGAWARADDSAPRAFDELSKSTDGKFRPTPTAAARPQRASSPAAKPPIVSSRQWGSAPDETALKRTPKQIPAWITIHHSGTLWKAGKDPADFLRKLQAWGKSPLAPKDEVRKAPFPDVPYHFMIAPDGRIFEGRPVMYEPQSNTPYAVNGNLGIELMGDFERQRPSPAQLRSLVALTAWLAQRHGIGLDHVRGHTDALQGAAECAGSAAPECATDCPGKDLYRYFKDGQLKLWLEEAARGETPRIAPGPALADGPAVPIPTR